MKMTKKITSLAVAAAMCMAMSTSVFAAEAVPSEKQAFVLADGLKNGLVGGLADGLKNGAVNGMPDGLKDGLADGLKGGLTNGLVDGLKDGLSKGLVNGGLKDTL